MSRARGNRYENAFMEEAERIGYSTFAARGSRGVVDVVCFINAHDYPVLARPFRDGPSLVVQVGTTAKPIARTLAELQAAPRPIGSLCVVARRIRAANRRISWKYSTKHGTYSTLLDAISAKGD